MSWPQGSSYAILRAVQRPLRSPRSAALALLTALTALCGLSVGCDGGSDQDPDTPSTLAERAKEAEEAKARPAEPARAQTPVAAAAEGSTPAATAGGLLKAGNKDGPTVTLRLALPDDTTYRVTTVGMVQYPAMPKPTGFAREEQIRLSECTGSGPERSCMLEHAISNFEAEPPYGRFIAADEAPARDVTTRYRISARGERIGEATLDGPAQTAQTPEVRALAGVDLFYCIRFPEGPVGVGAAWEATCVIRNDARVSERKLTWEVSSIEETDGHTRVELHALGNTTTVTTKGQSQGSFGGSLFFLADIGEPHLLREEINTAVAQDGGVKTNARLNYQFAKVVGDKVLRTDGEPFPDKPAAPAKAPPDTPKKAAAATKQATPDKPTSDAAAGGGS